MYCYVPMTQPTELFAKFYSCLKENAHAWTSRIITNKVLYLLAARMLSSLAAKAIAVNFCEASSSPKCFKQDQQLLASQNGAGLVLKIQATIDVCWRGKRDTIY